MWDVAGMWHVGRHGATATPQRTIQTGQHRSDKELIRLSSLGVMFPFIGQPEPLGFASDRRHTETLSETLTGFRYTSRAMAQYIVTSVSCFKVYTRFETRMLLHSQP